jgi:hypothetical protein
MDLFARHHEAVALELDKVQQLYVKSKDQRLRHRLNKLQFECKTLLWILDGADDTNMNFICRKVVASYDARITEMIHEIDLSCMPSVTEIE